MKRFICLLLITTSLGFKVTARAEQEEIILFTSPPSVQEMADLLFPVRKKGVSLNLNKKKKIPAFYQDKEVFFDHNKHTINASFFANLDVIGNALKTPQAGNRSVIIIEGHTDASGTKKYNQTLSEKRAYSVKQYLVSRFNIDPDRLRAVGRGEVELINTLNPRAAINRRVQFRSLK